MLQNELSSSSTLEGDPFIDAEHSLQFDGMANSILKSGRDTSQARTSDLIDRRNVGKLN